MAMLACQNSGHAVSCDFVEVSKIVKAGATTNPPVGYLKTEPMVELCPVDTRANWGQKASKMQTFLRPLLD